VFLQVLIVPYKVTFSSILGLFSLHTRSLFETSTHLMMQLVLQVLVVGLQYLYACHRPLSLFVRFLKHITLTHARTHTHTHTHTHARTHTRICVCVFVFVVCVGRWVGVGVCV